MNINSVVYEAVHSAPCCSSGCDGYVHYKDEDKGIAQAKKDLKSIFREAADTILQAPSGTTPANTYPVFHSSEEYYEHVALIEKRLLEQQIELASKTIEDIFK